MESCPLPLLVRLLEHSAAGLPPAEVAAAGYRPQVAEFDLGVDGWAVLAEPVRFGPLPALTAVGVDVTARRRCWSLPLERPVDVPDGAEVRIPAGALRLRALGVGQPRGELPDAPVTVVVAADVAAAGSAVGARLGGGESAGSQADTQG